MLCLMGSLPDHVLWETPWEKRAYWIEVWQVGKQLVVRNHGGTTAILSVADGRLQRTIASAIDPYAQICVLDGALIGPTRNGQVVAVDIGSGQQRWQLPISDERNKYSLRDTLECSLEGQALTLFDKYLHPGEPFHWEERAHRIDVKSGKILERRTLVRHPNGKPINSSRQYEMPKEQSLDANTMVSTERGQLRVVRKDTGVEIGRFGTWGRAFVVDDFVVAWAATGQLIAVDPTRLPKPRRIRISGSVRLHPLSAEEQPALDRTGAVAVHANATEATIKDGRFEVELEANGVVRLAVGGSYRIEMRSAQRAQRAKMGGRALPDRDPRIGGFFDSRSCGRSTYLKVEPDRDHFTVELSARCQSPPPD